MSSLLSFVLSLELLVHYYYICRNVRRLLLLGQPGRRAGPEEGHHRSTTSRLYRSLPFQYCADVPYLFGLQVTLTFYSQELALLRDNQKPLRLLIF